MVVDVVVVVDVDVVDVVVVDAGVVVVGKVVVDAVVVVELLLNTSPIDVLAAGGGSFDSDDEIGWPSANSANVSTPTVRAITRRMTAARGQRGPLDRLTGGSGLGGGVEMEGPSELHGETSASTIGGSNLEVGTTGGGGVTLTMARTFSWPRSSEWKARPVPTVAAALPTTTPTMVPPTPRNESARAAAVAPRTEARTCFKLRRMACSLRNPSGVT